MPDARKIIWAAGFPALKIIRRAVWYARFQEKLERIFDACGVGERSFYYPYPDYKFMTTVYSDAYLPGRGELSNNLRNFDRDRMLLFDEKSAFDGIVEEGLFSVFPIPIWR